MRRGRRAHVWDSHLAAPKASSPRPLNEGRRRAARPTGSSPLPRIAAVALILAAIALVAVLLFRGGGGAYEVTATFENGGQLVKGNQVEVGGRPIGVIKDIELTS